METNHELVELIYKEETEKHHLFTIKVKVKIISLFRKSKIETISINCIKNKKYGDSMRISNGDSLWCTMLYIDKAIDAILETKSRCYKKDEY